MSPEGQCVDNGDLASKDFLTRVLQLPSLRQAITLYNYSKEHHYVGAALQVAEAGVCVAASTALPLAGPIIHTVGGWEALDQWACKGLDRIQEAAPIINRPSHEIVQETRSVVLRRLAGEEVEGENDASSAPPATLTAALSTRTNTIGKVVWSSPGGVMLVAALHRLLNAAHKLIDLYLPPEKDDTIIDYDGYVGVKMEALIEKGRRRVRQRVCSLLHVNQATSVNHDDFVITTGHLVELSRRMVVSWYECSIHWPYLGRVVQAGGVTGALLLDATIAIQTTIITTATALHRATVNTTLSRAVADGAKIMRGLARRGVTVASESMQNGRNIVNVSIKSGRRMANSGAQAARGVANSGVSAMTTAARDGGSVVQSLSSSGVDVVRSAARRGIIGAQFLAESGVPVVRSAATTGIVVAKTILTVHLLFAYTMLKNGMIVIHNSRNSLQTMASTIQSRTPTIYQNIVEPVLSKGSLLTQSIVVRIRYMFGEVVMRMENVGHIVMTGVTGDIVMRMVNVGNGVINIQALASLHAALRILSISPQNQQTVQELVRGLHSSPLPRQTTEEANDQDATSSGVVKATEHFNSPECTNSTTSFISTEENLVLESKVCVEAAQSGDSAMVTAFFSEYVTESEEDADSDDTFPDPLQMDLFK